MPRAVHEAAQATRSAIAERGAVPSLYVTSGPAVAAETRADARTVLSDICSEDPGRQADAIVMARQLDSNDLGYVITGLQSSVRRMKLRIALQASIALLLPAALQAVDWFSQTTNSERRFYVENLPFLLFMAGFLAYPLLRARERLRRLALYRSDLSEARAATAADEKGLEIPLLLDVLRSSDMGVRARAL